MKHLFLFITGFLLCGLISAQSASPREFLPPFNFQVDSTTLLATWEAPKIVLLNEDFEGDVFPPEGWTASSLGVGWQGVEDPEYNWWWVVPEHQGRFAQMNDDIAPYSNDGSIDYLNMPLLDLTVADSFKLVFTTYFDGSYGQIATVEYSLDNGNTWQLLKKLEADLNWHREEIDLTAFSGPEGASGLQLAFHANDKADNSGWWASGWAVDSVTVYSDQIPLEVSGYHIFLDSIQVETVNLNNYQYFFEYNDRHSCGIAVAYGENTSDTIWKDVHSYFLPPPEELTATHYTYYYPDYAQISWYPPVGYQQDPPDNFSKGIRDVGEVIYSFPAPAPIIACQGICDDGYNLWITDPTLSSNTIYQVNLDGELTGVEITVNQGQSWIGGMAAYNNILYAILVGGPNSIVKVDLGTGETLAIITGDWSVIPQQALTADLKNQEFYIGGWSGGMIWRTDFNGVTISTHIFPDISGLAWEQSGGIDNDGSLWVVANSSSSLVTEIAPNNGWMVYQSFQMPGGQPYSGAGAAISRICSVRGLLWLCNKVDNTIYLVDLEEPWGYKNREYLPENLIGYYIYRDGGFRNFTDCTDPCWCNYSDYLNLKDSTNFKYEVSALFDLSPYGFPGDTGESLKSEPAFLSLSYVNELDFFESWTPPSPNYWEFYVNKWTVDPAYGIEPPAAVFKTSQVLYEYEQALETWQIVSENMPGDKILEYDVSLASYNPTGSEKLLVEVFDYANRSWNTVKTYSNLEGNISWRRDTHNITNFFNDEHFRIRFNAIGENSNDIGYWAVDNIAIFQDCYPPKNLLAELKPPALDSVLLTWDEPLPEIAGWWEWDDGVNSNSMGFGTGKESSFGIAAKWTPELLKELKGARLTAIGFVPGDLSASFKIAVWHGDNLAPVYLQATGNLILDEWNVIQLDEPITIDIMQDLYVGYKLSAYTGYPIGMDDGPAIDGFGNLIQGGDNEWQTLLDLNPDLSFNWNIKAYFERDGIPADSYQLYRSLDGNEAELIAEIESLEYSDTVSSGYITSCYKVKSIFDYGCTSDFSEEQCVVFTNADEDNLDEANILNIYPNPASDVLFIESEEKIESLTIFDSRGITIEQLNNRTVEQWNGEREEIPVRSLSPGLYLVKVETVNGTVAKKVVVGR